MKKRVFSGIQPTGNLTIGNYLGAIKNWTILQDDNQCLFCIVDLHSITVSKNPNEQRESILLTYAAYLASGIDPKKSIIFQQSAISEHAELAWILSCIAPIGWLNRMTQFKDKAGKNKEKASVGLYSYPILMAADILLYHTKCVPIGEDQIQHLELTRDIASAFNRNYEKEYFTLPEYLVNKNAMRIMSLRDGAKKMSKSDESDFSRINLTDDADLIARKIKKAKTDAISDITYDLDNRPEITNLIKIYSALENLETSETVKQLSNLNNTQFKDLLTQSLIDNICPIGREIKQLLRDRGYLLNLMQEGAKKAKEIAFVTLKEVKEIVGLI